jgi:hypothetical protein
VHQIEHVADEQLSSCNVRHWVRKFQTNANLRHTAVASRGGGGGGGGASQRRASYVGEVQYGRPWTGVWTRADGTSLRLRAPALTAAPPGARDRQEVTSPSRVAGTSLRCPAVPYWPPAVERTRPI